MSVNFTYNQGNTSGATNSTYSNATSGMGSSGGGYSGGGGGSNYSGGSNVTFTNPTSRTINFTVTSSPNGASIIVDGVNSGFTTPHTLQYSESELLSPKRISLLNGSSNSIETYILSSQTVSTTTGGNTSGGGSGGGGGSYGGGYSGGGSNNGMYDPTNPYTNRGDFVNEQRPELNIK